MMVLFMATIEIGHLLILILPEMEPRRQRADPVEALIDLAATLEDHGEVWLGPS